MAKGIHRALFTLRFVAFEGLRSSTGESSQVLLKISGSRTSVYTEQPRQIETDLTFLVRKPNRVCANRYNTGPTQRVEIVSESNVHWTQPHLILYARE